MGGWHFTVRCGERSPPSGFTSASRSTDVRPGVRAVVLACCLVTAGCTGLLAEQSGDTTETVTPAPVPTATDAAGAAQPTAVAPGLTERSVDADELVAAHADRLSNTSYTVTRQRQITAADGTVRRSRETRIQTSAGSQRYVAVHTVSGAAVADREVRTEWADGRAVRWTTEDGRTDREVVADATGIGGLDPREEGFVDPTYADRLRTLFERTAVTSVAPTRTEVTQRYSVPVYYVTAEGAADGVAVLGASRVDRVVLTASVSPAGLVRSYAVRYSIRRNGTEYSVVESAKYTDIGATTVNVTASDEAVPTDAPAQG